MENKQKRKRWLLSTKEYFGDLDRGNDKRDEEPWASGQKNEKPYSPGATGPAFGGDSNPNDTGNSNGENYLYKYLGRPGMDYDVQQHND